MSCKEYFDNECAYCGLHIEDHYVTFNGSIIKSDFHKEHVNCEGNNELSNCIPSCKFCNCSKHNRNLEDWYNKNNPNFKIERLYKILKWINDDYQLYEIKKDIIG